MVSPSLAPTWMLMVWSLASTSTPLNDVCSEIRSISSRRWVISSWIDCRSDCELVPLDACTASSRMRCRLSFTWSSAPSVVCAREMPSLALLLACSRPVICEVMRLAMAWPAASSEALLIFRPEDRRSIEVLRLLSEALRFCWAISEVMLVLITDILQFLSWVGTCGKHGAALHALSAVVLLSARTSAHGKPTFSATLKKISPTHGAPPAARSLKLNSKSACISPFAHTPAAL
ncbi:hypothetical protein D3C78_313510 [compost metagenome]